MKCVYGRPCGTYGITGDILNVDTGIQYLFTIDVYSINVYTVFSITTVVTESRYTTVCFLKISKIPDTADTFIFYLNTENTRYRILIFFMIFFILFFYKLL